MKRYTKQRQIIYEVVLAHLDHPDVESIYNDVHKIAPHISKGTVYRNLNSLAEEGLIKQIEVPYGNRFDLRNNEHDHIYCVMCGKVIDSPLSYDSNSDKEISEKAGFKITGHATLFKGICPDCLNKKRKED